jgi:hypothetical protein
MAYDPEAMAYERSERARRYRAVFISNQPWTCLQAAFVGSGPLIKHRFFMAILIIAIVLAMTGWVYALGWVALKLI